MAKVGAQRAADLTGKSKSTIQRAMNNGKLSFELDPNGRRVVDVSELDRAFGLQQSGSVSAPAAPSVEEELEKASALIETERLKMRIKMLENQLEAAETQIEDLKAQRDQWQKQASQVLLTSQYSQKQAEELAEQLKERERRSRERREQFEKQKLEDRMKKMQADNENAQDDEGDGGNAFSGLWKRVKGAR
ncbi:MAG: entry exclusion 1 domain-containing protein [Rhodospirillales bacterium]|nr:entry exclusion 1 domain-containing protein [Rhodospirillales bacterium]